MVFRRKYGAAATLDGVPLVTTGSEDYKAAPTLAAGDVKVSKDGGAFANLATLPAVTPAAGRAVQVALSATEMQAARVVIQFVDQTSPKEWADQFVIVETFGHASAQERANMSDAMTELSQAQPSATPTPDEAIMLGYMRLRNRRDESTSEEKVYNDAGTVIAKGALTDDGTTFSKAKLATGP